MSTSDKQGTPGQQDRNKAHWVESALDGVKEIEGINKDAGLVDVLAPGGSTSMVSRWRSRPTVPIDELLAYAEQKGVSLDWLFFRAGDRYRPGSGYGARSPLAEIAGAVHATLVAARQELDSERFAALLDLLLAERDRVDITPERVRALAGIARPAAAPSPFLGHTHSPISMDRVTINWVDTGSELRPVDSTLQAQWVIVLRDGCPVVLDADEAGPGDQVVARLKAEAE